MVKGEFDQCLDFCQEPILRLVPQVQEVTLAGASHMMTEEVPQELMTVITTFLEGL